MSKIHFRTHFKINWSAVPKNGLHKKKHFSFRLFDLKMASVLENIVKMIASGLEPSSEHRVFKRDYLVRNSDLQLNANLCLLH